MVSLATRASSNKLPQRRPLGMRTSPISRCTASTATPPCSRPDSPAAYPICGHATKHAWASGQLSSQAQVLTHGGRNTHASAANRPKPIWLKIRCGGFMCTQALVHSVHGMDHTVSYCQVRRCSELSRTHHSSELATP